MPRMELLYLDHDDADTIEKLSIEFAEGVTNITHEEFIRKITSLLPITKTDISTVRRRVEGYYYATEVLWKEALKMKIGSRQDIVRLAKLKPLSHYHYLTGSREPHGNVMTRADYLNDPSTALVKLRDDITGLARVFPKLREGVSTE